MASPPNPPVTPLVIPSSSRRSPTDTSASSPNGGTPQSAIISVPADWNNSVPSSGQNSIGGRPSMDEESFSGRVEPPLPMSASSSSSSSQPIFDWSSKTSHASAYINQLRRDPFDSSDPFDPHSSSSEDDLVPRLYGGRRGSNLRSSTDPLLHDGQPIDPEFTSAGPPVDEFHFEPPPAFNRTFSSPLPNRVGYLRHPLSPVYDSLGSAHPPISAVTSEPPPTARPPSTLHTVSLELADALQSAIQTLLHLSPPHLLDNAKEQYSGCTVQVPATSLSALLTSMRGLNYLSAHSEELIEGPDHGPNMRKGEDFDIGELLQNVADMLSGQASQKAVDFVLFHGDVGIKHVSVNGDGEGLSYALSHVIRQILLITNRDDTIELGLQVIPQSPSLTPRIGQPLTPAEIDQHRGQKSASSSRSNSPGRTSLHTSSGYNDGPLLCIFEIVHNIAQASDSTHVTPKAELNPFTQLAEQSDAAKPNFNTTLCRRLLQGQNAVLRVDVQPSSPLGTGMPRRAYELSILLPRGRPIVEPTPLSIEEEAIRQPFTSMRLSREPTLNELSEFADSLRTKKVAIHANLSSVFARHLTSYLAAWGMDISHIPIDGDEGDKAKPIPTGRHDSGYGGSTAGSTPAGDVPMSITPSARDSGRFIIVDDDVAVLRRELFRIRAELHPLSLKPRLTKRPTLTARTRSTPHVRQVTARPSSAILIHFTSLARYNQVREIVSSFVGAPWATGSGAYIQPEVMVIPKPVGPRRFLTALHTAVSQPIVDPFFSPIATSPRSPGGGYFASNSRTPTTEREGSGGFFDSVAEESTEEPRDEITSQKARSPLGEHPPSAAQIVRTDQGMHLSLPTPGEILATPANEYFTGSGRAIASGSGASGVVMQSPDGRPFGMFFEPPVRNERRVSNQRIPSDSLRRKPTSRRTSAGGEETSTSPAISPSSSRRISNVSTVAPTEERRGSFTERPQHSRMASRRRTLPVSESPIVAVGRDRSATVTQTQRRGTPSASPTILSPKPDQASFAVPPRPPPKKALSPAQETPEPEKKAAPRPAKKAPKDDVVVPPINVLIVEDNPINQNILSMFLRKKKIKHQSAKDGLEAVEKWRTGGFHLILMDIQLPVMDGIEATKEIRKLERHNNIGVFPSTPVVEHSRAPSIESSVPSSPFRSSVIIVALTASSLQSDRVAALAAGCNDFLTKPVSLKWLDKKIVEWGCMQALIDFDGWRRWKSSDPKDANETKKGFSLGPQAAAKSLASRLRIERKGTRSPAPSSPEVRVQVSTPEPSETPPPVTNLPIQSAAPPPDPAPVPEKLEAAALSSIDEVTEGSTPLAKHKSLPTLDHEANGAGEHTDEKPLPPLPTD
ncbi:osomolarity two-component system, response regulator SSK1 [Kwoniella heveanensis CBS 569]|uniref:Osomolarity two-component system, response regulator SSK1 n=1 Tax=Kwoniella heveanensis BCC8398 TaxID=1296120 RepID=A0A1B9GWY5_9TREE|nr:osomolarity two-component system, response regulator SSK1 [Kwoniella heveanensis BCC8398]OCF41225.1 osomolarity two-component system, response regulator SSK1 [Kwoniella heveanensis CBS 569]